MQKVATSHEDLIHDVQLDYYGKRMATCSSDRTVKVYDVVEGGERRQVADLKGHVASDAGQSRRAMEAHHVRIVPRVLWHCTRAVITFGPQPRCCWAGGGLSSSAGGFGALVDKDVVGRLARPPERASSIWS